ncbi:hypothetical protein J3Q64DRAFT_1851691 [Phycomyces blakesleeanus]|uniref:Uncharacterized protein n=2 Tax=Phycomyces blakesleeanus TaxID=4837 RepID=A0A162QA13_PHYB8|nr:hypothetical protein PHYBLDRAFT_138871 [Phycomyces blakesleeanus NRRL 1555(-)]OAD81326.1 hypothetical protein PHYBLDRAFT_138871 [Phycomyces blakesleeanus NRRL 1555(-)]|eukprot:XP_018299366.1 hypothetical protein PHYBLDRAFT_138871 [Phycomyces blakesleeanus NRRL 1555(-)]
MYKAFTKLRSAGLSRRSETVGVVVGGRHTAEKDPLYLSGSISAPSAVHEEGVDQQRGPRVSELHRRPAPLWLCLSPVLASAPPFLFASPVPIRWVPWPSPCQCASPTLVVAPSSSTNFFSSVLVAPNHAWISMRKLRVSLSVAASQNFSTSEGRRFAKAAITSMLSQYDAEALFGQAKSFPGNEAFVDLSVVDWPSQSTGLLQVLDFEQAESRTGPSNAAEGSTAPGPGTGDGCYTQASFETAYNLN